MTANMQIASLLVGLFLLWLVFRLVKRGLLNASYTVLWVAICLFFITLPVFQGLYKWLAVSVLGLSGGDHMIYLALFAFLMAFALYITTKLCLMNNRIGRLITHTAILENELERIRRGQGGSGDTEEEKPGE